jgi:hypothetical protein
MSNADGQLERFDPAGIEADLFRVFAAQPSGQALAALDQRMEKVLRAPRRRGSGVRRLRPGRKEGVVGLLAASFAVLGATGSLQGLYTFLWGPFDTPWHRGTEVNLSQVVDGYRVTIDRAYGDAARLALAISVVDEQRRPGISQVMAMSTIVSDAAGEYASGGGAVSSPDGPFAAVNVVWKTPPVLPVPSGPRAIHVVMPFIMVRDNATPPPNPDLDPSVEGDEWNPWHEVAGPWTFDFELDIDGGTAVTPLDASASAAGHTVVVERVIVTPSIVRVDVAVDPDRPADWSPIGEVQHNGRVARFVVGSFEPGGRTTLMTDGGLGDASGSWTVVVSELVGGGDERIAGPWTITFTVP